MATDRKLQDLVIAELRWDARVPDTAIGVEARDGIVRLTGTVSNFADRLAAREAAHSVYGVRDVADDIEVRLTPDHDDLQLGQAVRLALLWDVAVPASGITTTVSDGDVTLVGAVPHHLAREAAERAVRQLRGVRGVHNHILVVPPDLRADDIRAAIVGALERRADRAANRISVSLADGVATLEGSVPSPADARAVLETARHTPGVRDVHDQLHVGV